MKSEQPLVAINKHHQLNDSPQIAGFAEMQLKNKYMIKKKKMEQVLYISSFS